MQAFASTLADQLGFAPGTYDVHDTSAASLSALQRHYLEQARRFNEDAIGVDQVYFSGEYPAVYFKTVPDFSPETVGKVVQLHRKIWNQGRVPFLYVEGPAEVRIYNCYDTPRPPGDLAAEDELRLATARTREALEELAEVFGQVGVESGTRWQGTPYAERVSSKTRVVEALTANLKTTRRQLRRMNLPLDIIHDLLLRSLFVLYLEDRGATGREFYAQLQPEAKTYFDLLAHPTAVYALFDTLETVFNGNLCPVHSDERYQVTAAHLAQLRSCFYAELPSAQATLFPDWRIFDFGIIPIHLISEIYEDFLREEDGADHMRQRGAFYTPHTLAEFVLNEVLPYPTEADSRSDLRVLDPTCGSGIFLVESLNRLLDRWEQEHTPAKLTYPIVEQIVLNNIFGIEIEPEAIKVAAFSLYLAMLDRLNPKTLWQTVRFPYLIYRPNNHDPNRQGHNLFLMSSLGSGPFEELTFDLVVGNPPFTYRVADEEVRSYLERYDFASEAVLAFLHRASELCPNGKIALLSTSKILFNTGRKYENFREFLFQSTYVEKVFNFSALRRVPQYQGGRNLFASAQRPVCLLLYQQRQPTKPSRQLAYYCPTAAIKNRLIDGITLDPSEISYLPRTECHNPATRIWKTAMWGTARDYQLVQHLVGGPTLANYLEENAFTHGVGFQLSENPRERSHFSDTLPLLPLADAARISRYHTPRSRMRRFADKHPRQLDNLFRRLGTTQAFQAPHVLIKAGQTNRRFCASYQDFDCSFKHTVFGISAPGRENDLKLLTAYLNSSLATYLLFLTASDWGVERESVYPNEILSLPDLCFGLASEVKQHIVGVVDQIISLEQARVLDNSYELSLLEDEIEKALWNGLQLTRTDRLLIKSVLRYRLDAFQDGRSSVAYAPATASHCRNYAEVLCATVNRFLPEDQALQAKAACFEVGFRAPLQVVVLYLDGRQQTENVIELPGAELNQLLHTIDNYTYREAAESIYYRRFVRYYQQDVVYLVKPNEQRCWSPASALHDADDLAAEIINQAAWVRE